MMKNEKYKKFQSSLIPSADPDSIIGVRVPDLRVLAGRLKKEELSHAFLSTLPHAYHEENYIHALLLSDMRDFAYDSEVIQRMVRSIHEMFVSLNFYPELDGKITPDAFARCVAPMFVDGQISLMHEHNYGKEGCIFIAKAIACYGGYGELDEL